VIALWLAGKLLKTKDAVRLPLDGLGTVGSLIYTNDKGQLADQLSRDVSHRSAMEPSRESISSVREIEPSSTRSQGHEQTRAESHSISR
jgi:hypothetical protein